MSEAAEAEDDDFEVIEEGEDLDIQVVDTTPEQDKGKALLPADKEQLDEPDEDEIKSYSDKVQKRIKDATFRFHDQRRKREIAERTADEATKFANAQLEKSRQLEAALYQYEAGYVDASKSRVDVELAQAQFEMKQAFDVGDADKMAAAQAKIAKLAVQQDQFSRFTPREAPEEKEEYKPQTQAGASQGDAERFIAWREKNEWFDNDETLRDFAMGIHTRLAASSPESVGTEDYYQDIEKRVKSAFPSKFQTEQRARPSASNNVVAGVSRSSGAEKARKTITLTSEQMRLCRKLGVTPQQYVREMMKTGD